MKRLLIVAALGLLLGANLLQSGSIKRWIDSEGNIHFGDTPPSSAVTTNINVKNRRQGADNSYKSQVKRGVGFEKQTIDAPADEKPGKDHRSYQERLIYRNAAVRGELMVNMSAKEARRAWGAPTSTESKGGKNGTQERWLYETATGKRRITLLNGRVVSWQ